MLRCVVSRSRVPCSTVYDASSFIEMITPFYPQRFLLLATIANVGKSVGVTTANVVRAPIQRSFALEENLAEVTAKTSAQQVRGLGEGSGGESAGGREFRLLPAFFCIVHLALCVWGRYL